MKLQMVTITRVIAFTMVMNTCGKGAGVNKRCGKAGGTRTHICDRADDGTNAAANRRKDGTLGGRLNCQALALATSLSQFVLTMIVV